MAVIVPLEYTTRVTSTFSWKLIPTVWMLGAIAAVPSSLQVITAGSMSPWFSCRNAKLGISLVNVTQSEALYTSTTLPFPQALSSTEYIPTPTTSAYPLVPSFIHSIPQSLRCLLAFISTLFCMLPLLALAYMYLRIFWEASKSGRDNRRR